MPIAVSFFVSYAYGILFLWVLLEQLGVPIPSIPLLLTAGTLAAAHKLNASYALGVVVLACLLADSAWYFLGRRYGGAVIRLLCRLSLEASTCVAKTQNYFERRGATTLLFAKFIPGLSTVAAPIAGQTGMRYERFLLWDLAGSVIWAEVYLLSGSLFGDVAKRSERLVHLASRWAFGLFLLMVLGFLAYRAWKNRRFLLDLRAMRLEPQELMHMLELATKQDNTPPFIADLRHPLDLLPDPRTLPGAIRISPSDLTANSDLLPKDRDVVLFCTCPNEQTSVRVAKQLARLGVHRVRPLRGGFEAWRDLGYPLVAVEDLTSASAEPARSLVAPAS